MVVIERIDDRGIKGVLTDGYLPDFSYFQGKDWEYALAEKLPIDETYRAKIRSMVEKRYLKTGRQAPGIGPQSNFHRKMKDALRKRFCPYNGERCDQIMIPAQGVLPMERVISFKKKKVRDKIQLPFLIEIKKAISEGKNYVFNLSYLDQKKDNHCPIFEDCSYNWMQSMGFEMKKVEEYQDFQEYRKAAEVYLEWGIDGIIRKNGFSREKILKWRESGFEMFNYR